MDAEISFKTSVDVARIRRACRVAEKCLRHLAPCVRPGISTAELDNLAGRFLEESGAGSALRGYRGFPGSICTSVNNVAAHGIPSNRQLESGDVLALDITAVVEGWHGDAAWTFLVGEATPDGRRLVRAAWQATQAGIRAAVAGQRMGDVGAAIQETAHRFGCSVIEDYVGHGIGRAMHEDPMIPNFGAPDTGLRILPGMVFTVEPMLTLGLRDVHISSDGWTLVTSDGSLSAQFEHTVAVFRDYTEVLTFSHGPLLDSPDVPPALG
ncbi:MAG: type I methionyl aminopeptidase [Spirochaetia bacterium]